MIIRTISDDDATGPVAEFYADDIEDQGHVAAHTRAMCLNPEALGAWESLMHAITVQMDRRRYELVTLAAAGGARSQHCRLAHGRVALRFFDLDQLERIALDHHDAGLTPAEVVMMDFAERVSRDSAEMTDADSRALRDAGFTDREIVDIAMAAAARNFYSRTIQALAVPVEQPLDVAPALRDALVHGL